MEAQRSQFRFDINTLRAIAVMGVILFHYHVPYFDGGFSGVDIFFVISGYLMTRIILNALKKDSLNILDFYNKRSLRIIPALLFVVVVTVAITFFTYLPPDFQIVTKNAASSLLFYSNHLYSKVDYFDASSDTNMFLHTWSLSVEWQFYLLLPLVLMLTNKILKNNRQKYLVLFIITTVLLCLFGFYIERQNPSVAFYYLPTRSWEMLVGGIAFLSEDKINTKYKKYLSIFGYVVLLLCFVFLREDMSWPGLYTLVPVIGTFLIIVSNYNDFSILKSPIIGYVGKISYSLYLWHWPIIVFCNYIAIELNTYSILAYIAASFILASLSYHLVENYKGVTIIKVRIGMAALVLITGLFTYKSINDVAFKDKTLEIARYKETHEEEAIKQLSRYTCFIDSKNREAKFNREKCLYIDPAKRNYILIGDSHAAHLSQSLKESLEKSNIHILQASVSGCTPVLKTRGEDRCTEVIGFMYDEFIPRNAPDIDGVIISANWVNNSNRNFMIKKIHATIDYLKKLNIPVILLGQNETYTIPYTSIAAREYEYSKPLGSNYINPKSADINQILSKEFKSLYIDIFNLDVCPKFSPSFTPYMSDQNHFTKYGADCAVKEILKNPDFIKFAQLK